MKGVNLAGGLGTRLSPLTEITSKHLLPVGKEPMIWRPVKQLKLAGIRDILVVTSVAHTGDVVSSLGSGPRFDCEFAYRIRYSAGGIAHALALAEHFCADCRVLVLPGNNIFERSIAPHVEAFARQAAGGPSSTKGGRRSRETASRPSTRCTWSPAQRSPRTPEAASPSWAAEGTTRRCGASYAKQSR